MEGVQCAYPQCTVGQTSSDESKALNLKRCSRCRNVFYCSQNHQKLHWKDHKSVCNEISSQSISNNNASTPSTTPHSYKDEKKPAHSASSASSESRSCRCMFCGELLVLSSEQAAIDHMAVCPSLQQQLNGDGQFTLPTEIEKKMKEGTM